LQLIARGTIKGALHTDNIDNILECVRGPLGTFDEIEQEIEDAVRAFSKETPGISDIILGVNALGTSFKKLGKAVNDCDEHLKDSPEMKVFQEMTDIFINAKSSEVVVKVSNNIWVNGVDIYHDLSAAYTNYLAKEYEQFGQDVGAALALTFIGPAGVGKLTNEDAEKLQTMSQAALYPLLTQRVYNDSDNKKYIDYLVYLSNSRANPEQSFDKPDLTDVGTFEMPEQADVDVAEIPAYIDGEAYYDAQE